MPPKTQPPKSRRTRPNGQDVTEGAPAAQGEVFNPRVQPVPAVRPPRAYYRKFGICRICLREAAHEGYIPGMTKSSW